MFLNNLNHSNIIKFLEFIPLPSGFGSILVLPEFGRPLNSWIPESVASFVSVFFQLFSALKCVHDNGVIHGDIKPENILIKDGHVLLIDFDVAQLSTLFELRGDGQGGSTFHYSAPETFTEERVNDRIDCWAVGITLAESLLGRPVFSATSIDELKAQQTQFVSSLSRDSFTKCVQNPQFLTDGVWSVLLGCIVSDPASRLSSSEIVNILQSETRQIQTEHKSQDPLQDTEWQVVDARTDGETTAQLPSHLRSPGLPIFPGHFPC